MASIGSALAIFTSPFIPEGNNLEDFSFFEKEVSWRISIGIPILFCIVRTVSLMTIY